ncbi:hypothetical protein SLE2022_040730 [Rubroshorea leprosula]
MNMNNLCTSKMSSSSSAFLVPTSFSSRAESVSVPTKRIGVIECVATPQQEQTDIFLISPPSKSLPLVKIVPAL